MLCQSLVKNRRMTFQKCVEVKVGLHNEFQEPKDLKFFFCPTVMKYHEIKKAHKKNSNLPILQLWYNGNSQEPLKCLISGKCAFSIFPDLITGEYKQRFDCDFNHIRQYQDGACYSGVSKDKGVYGPSDIFRTYLLSESVYILYLVEFMTIIPVSREMHSYISQDSAKGHITLKNYKKEWWPWGLQSKDNFDNFCSKYDIHMDYFDFIDHLSNIEEPPIKENYWLRLKK